MLSLLRKNYCNKFRKQLLVVAEMTADLNCQERLNKEIRALSTLNGSIPLAEATVYKDERRKFMAVFPDLVANLTEYASKYQLKNAVKLYEKALQYNLPRGKQNRGLVTVQTYKKLADRTQLTRDNIKLAQYLGWCVEMLQSAGLVLDDMEDGGATRRGQPCWHNLEEVGLGAINDSLLIENGILQILKQFFAQKDCYVQLVELFNEVCFITLLGQSQDIQTSKADLSSFTMDRYKNIVANKTSYYTFYLPVAAALHLCGFTDPDVYRQTKTILLEIGNLFQVQDDFIDCFGDPEITGKLGTDIQKNKCSWLAVVCMEKASVAQKEIMRECYGKTDPVKIAQVKHLYEELGLPNLYTAYKEETINMIKIQIQQTSTAVPSHLYRIFVPFFSTKTQAGVFGSSHTSA